MARLPVQGQDIGVWGGILNDFLDVEHNADGTLKIRTDGTFYSKPSGGVPASDLSAAVQAALTNANSAVQPGTALSHDLSGTVATPTVAGIKGIPIVGTASDGQVLAYSSGSNQWIPSTVGSGGTVSDATGSSKGVVQLAGDLGGGVAGTAASPQVTSVHLASPLSVSMGGTGAATQQAAINTLAGTQSSGKYLRSDGTNTTLSNIQAGDVPTLNQNTTGNAASATLASTVTTNANLTGPITSTGNATSVASQTGTGSTFVMNTSPVLAGTPTAPTATAGTNTTQIATTAFVSSAVSGISNFVDLTTNQTIGGNKTFSNTIVGSISGNAATVTTNANLTGDVTSVGNATTVAKIQNVTISGTPGSGNVLTATSSTAANWAAPAAGFADPTTTKGDLIVHGASSTTRIGVGSNGQVLTADSAQTNGLAWENIAGGTLATVTNQQGQPLVLGASGALAWGYPWQFNVMGYGAKGDGSTDDTAAIQSAINAAVTYAQSNGGYCEVIIPPTSAYYAINGALVQGGSTLGNAQITLPVIDPTVTTNIKVTLVIKGTENATGQYHWLQTATQKTGATLVSNGVFASAGNQLTSINSFGNPCVIGGPNQKGGGSTPLYGTSALNFSNMLVVIKGLSIMTAVSTTGLNYSAMDFSGLAQAQVLDSQWGQNTTYANTWHNAGNISTLSTGLSIGLLMPAAGNNDNNVIRDCIITGGFFRGVFLTEHTVVERMAVIYCYSAICPVGNYLGSAGALHAIVGDQISVEGYHNLMEVIGAGQSGVGPIMDFQLDTESTPVFAGTGLSTALGTVRIAGSIPGSFTVPTTGMKIVQEYRAIGAVATPSFTLGTAFLNPYWHDAFVQIAGGTVTAVKQGATLAGTSAPTMNDTNLTSGMFLVPAGGWLEIDGSVAPTVNNWTLI